jgi:TolA-binding protein
MKMVLMMMMMMLLLAAGASAQVSTDEAQHRLQERQQAKDADRSRLVTIKKGELDDLRAELRQLRREVAMMQKELGLSQGKEAARDDGGVIAAPARTFATRAKDGGRDVKEAQKIDARIAAHLLENQISPEIAKGMWAGQPVVGMTMEELKMIGFITVVTETAHSQILEFDRLMDQAIHARVYVTDGRVTQVDH